MTNIPTNNHTILTPTQLALWANRIQHACLIEAGNDVEAGLLAAELIVSAQPIPTTDFYLSIEADNYPRNNSNQFVNKYLIAEAARNVEVATKLRESIPELERIKLDILIQRLQWGGSISHPKEASGLAINIEGQVADTRWVWYEEDLTNRKEWEQRNQQRITNHTLADKFTQTTRAVMPAIKASKSLATINTTVSEFSIKEVRELIDFTLSECNKIVDTTSSELKNLPVLDSELRQLSRLIYQSNSTINSGIESYIAQLKKSRRENATELDQQQLSEQFDSLVTTIQNVYTQIDNLYEEITEGIHARTEEETKSDTEPTIPTEPNELNTNQLTSNSGRIALGYDEQGNFRGPRPPGPGWVAAGQGPRGGKIWKFEKQVRGDESSSLQQPSQQSANKPSFVPIQVSEGSPADILAKQNSQELNDDDIIDLNPVSEDKLIDDSNINVGNSNLNFDSDNLSDPEEIYEVEATGPQFTDNIVPIQLPKPGTPSTSTVPTNEHGRSEAGEVLYTIPDEELANAQFNGIGGFGYSLNQKALGTIDIGGQKAFWKGIGSRLAEHESLVASLFEMAGLRTPAVRSIDVVNAPKMEGQDGGMVAEFVEGQTLDNQMQMESFDNIEQQLLPGEVDRNALFGFLLAISDRHTGNYMVEGNRLVSIDHEFSLGRKFGGYDENSNPKPPIEFKDDEDHVVSTMAAGILKHRNKYQARDETMQLDPAAVHSIAEVADKVAEAVETIDPQRGMLVRRHAAALKDFAEGGDYHLYSLHGLRQSVQKVMPAYPPIEKSPEIPDTTPINTNEMGRRANKDMDELVKQLRGKGPK